MSKPPRPIHVNHPQGFAHPFKGATLCGLLVRFGGLEHPGRPATCKNCLKRQRMTDPVSKIETSPPPARRERRET